MNRLFSRRFWGVSGALFLTTFAATIASATTFSVTSDATLSSALSQVNAGDTVVMADGNYTGFTLSRSGAAGAPITIKAANQGNAVVTSGIIHFAKTSLVQVQGLKITSNGGGVTADGTSRNLIVWFEAANSCQITRCTFAPPAPLSNDYWNFLSGASDNNRIDHCDMGNNAAHTNHFVFPCGNSTIPGVTPPTDRTAWANGGSPFNPNMSRHTRIDHNYFHDTSSGEAIVLGGIGVTGDYQDTHSLVESNLFVNCDGDPEIVSTKSSSNILRFNTVRTCNGVFSLRSGNKSQIYNNFFLCAGIGGGVKLNEQDALVYNNYMENTDTSNYPIMMEGGDAYSDPAFAHAQVFRAHIIYNTCVNCGRQINVGHGGGLPPTDCVIANNIVTGSAGQSLLLESAVPVNMIYNSNVTWPTRPSGKTINQFRQQNPGFQRINGMYRITGSSPVRNSANTSYYSFVTVDIDGQQRMAPDIGADEFSSAPVKYKPLATTDVGPLAP